MANTECICNVVQDKNLYQQRCYNRKNNVALQHANNAAKIG